MKKYITLFMLICGEVMGQTTLFQQNSVNLTFYKPTSTNTGGGGCCCGGNQFGYTFADYAGSDIELSCEYAISLSCFCSGTSINGTSGLSTVSLPNESYEVWIKTTSTTFTNAQGLVAGFSIGSGAYGALGLKNVISNLTIQSLSSTPPPCPATITYQSPADDFSTSPSLKTASASIVASNKITGTATTVTYHAGSKVEFTAGFKADTGTVFKAQIGGCN